MNYGRLVAAAAAATVVDAVYGFLVYGTLLANEFGRYPGVYRPNDTGPSYLPLMFVGIFAAMIAVAFIYAKGYEGGPGVVEGLRFGVLVGVFVIGYVAGVNYAILNISGRLALLMAAAGFIEWLAACAVIGAVYKPVAVPASRRTVGV
jgi:hypothetical protein